MEKWILVLDDVKSVHDRIQKALAALDFRVSGTDSWVAIKTAVFSGEPPDLLILDLQMPTIDGKAVGKAIKRRLKIPIILFSSERPETLSQCAAEVGAEAALSKSVSDTELVGVIRRVITSASLQTAAASNQAM